MHNTPFRQPRTESLLANFVIVLGIASAHVTYTVLVFYEPRMLKVYSVISMSRDIAYFVFILAKDHQRDSYKEVDFCFSSLRA